MAEQTPPRGDSDVVQTPTHPVPQLQGPFEESMLESVYDDSEPEQYLDPASRRAILLESVVYQRVVAGRWKQKPGEKFHPLWKLVAQISFGVHLLAESMAKSEEDVMEILQTHVDEIDGFLERTTEDFELSMDDIQERLRCLKLPLRHPEVFERMLEDRKFRNSIVEGNEKIEHIIDRTSRHMKDSLKDVQKGFDSTAALEIYLHGLEVTWQRRTAEHEAVFVAMLGNVEGWRKAFTDLHLQGSKLAGLLRKLTQIINEMQQRAGEVSRKLLHQARGFDPVRSSRAQHSQTMGRPATGSAPVSRFQAGGASQKRLPTAPAKSLAGTLSTIQQSRSQSPLQSQLDGRQSSATSPQSRVASPASQQLLNIGSPTVITKSPIEPLQIRSVAPSVIEEIQSPGSETSKAEKEPTSTTTTFPMVELPAHVPGETLRSAPISKANRLSMGLGILPSDRKMKSSPKSYSPTAALIDMLRNSPNPSNSTKLPLTPQSMTPNSASPVAIAPSEADSGYFASKDTRSQTDSTTNQHESDSLRIDTRSATNSPALSQVVSPYASAAEERRAELRRGAFNSHPPDQPLGSPPTMHSSTPVLSSQPSITRMPSASEKSFADDGTLGEPGPELTGSVSDVDVRPANHLKRASAMAPELVMTRTPQMQDIVSPLEEVKDPVSEDAEKTAEKKSFVAEMEGCAPKFLDLEVDRSPAFVELEAPFGHIKSPSIHELPSATVEPKPLLKPDVYNPNSRQSAVSTESKETASESITRMTDVTTNEHVSEKAVSEVSFKSPIKADEKDIPVANSTAPQELQSQTSYTPPGSPVHHSRAVSTISNNSAMALMNGQVDTVVSNHPPAELPASGTPPIAKINTAVGGTTYVEHKPHNRSSSKASIGSHKNQNMWKAFFQGSASPVGGSLSIRSLRRTSTDQQSLASRKSPVGGSASPLQPATTSPNQVQGKAGESMMTSAGKDVLWFGKTDGMERVALNSASKNQNQQKNRPPSPKGLVEME